MHGNLKYKNHLFQCMNTKFQVYALQEKKSIAFFVRKVHWMLKRKKWVYVVLFSSLQINVNVQKRLTSSVSQLRSFSTQRRSRSISRSTYIHKHTCEEELCTFMRWGHCFFHVVYRNCLMDHSKRKGKNLLAYEIRRIFELQVEQNQWIYFSCPIQMNKESLA